MAEDEKKIDQAKLDELVQSKSDKEKESSEGFTPSDPIGEPGSGGKGGTPAGNLGQA